MKGRVSKGGRECSKGGDNGVRCREEARERGWGGREREGSIRCVCLCEVTFSPPVDRWPSRGAARHSPYLLTANIQQQFTLQTTIITHIPDLLHS